MSVDNQTHPDPIMEFDYYAHGVEAAADQLDTQIEAGLNKQQVSRRRQQYGLNRLRTKKRRSAVTILIDQFKSLVLILLLVAALIAFLFGQLPEAIAIIAVLIVNTTIGFISELRAVRSMQALRAMGKQRTRVRRQGQEYNLVVDKLVPGDIVLLEGGDIVPADLRLAEANALRVKEAPLTGESVSVIKQTEKVTADTPLAERTNMLYRGTTVTEGSGVGLVTATGMQTELGRIAALVQEQTDELTPLEVKLEHLGKHLAWITLCVAAVLAVIGLLTGKPTLRMIETAIALGVAAIPEGLPIVATLALARGMWIMARRQVLINRLAAVETLGTTEVIFTDKTGTLTENCMRVRRIITARQSFDFNDDETAEADSDAAAELLEKALEIGVLCSNASLRDEDRDRIPEATMGDPTEVALLRAGLAHDMRRPGLLEQYPEQREVPFDQEKMMMATYHQNGNQLRVAVKGAPDAVLPVCEQVMIGADQDQKQQLTAAMRQEWLAKAEQLASQGLRLIAVAEKYGDDPQENPYKQLNFVGLIGLLDPPRQGVQEALQACRSAGITVIMVTGDRPETALSIARQVELVAAQEETVITGQELGENADLSEELIDKILSCRVFARVTPQQKLKIMKVYKEYGYTVAMTGDGVNDAPALKTADIGVAMGQRGTDAARQSSDMVLRDDAFSSIVAAVEQGRIIFKNIRKSVMFMLCTNVAEVMAVGVAAFVNLPLPLRALQILYLNVITDVFPALALSVGRGSTKVMQEKARKENIMTRSHWKRVVIWGIIMATGVLSGLIIGQHLLGFSKPKAVTISFLVLAFSKLMFTFNLRDLGSRLCHNDIVRNKWVWVALALCILLLLAAVYIPELSQILKTVPPGQQGWLVILALALVPFILGQLWLGRRGKLLVQKSSGSTARR